MVKVITTTNKQLEKINDLRSTISDKLWILKRANALSFIQSGENGTPLVLQKLKLKNHDTGDIMQSVSVDDYYHY